MKGFLVRADHIVKPMPLLKFRIFMTCGAGLYYLSGRPCLVKPRRHMSIEDVNEIPRPVARPALGHRALRNAGSQPFNEGERPVKWLLVAVLAVRIIFGIFLQIPACVVLAVNALIQYLLHGLVGKPFPAGRLYDMALHCAVHLLGGLVRYLVYIPVAVIALELPVRTAFKHLFIDVEQAEFAVFVNPAESNELVAEYAVQLVGCRCRPFPRQRPP